MPTAATWPPPCPLRVGSSPSDFHRDCAQIPFAGPPPFRWPHRSPPPARRPLLPATPMRWPTIACDTVQSVRVRLADSLSAASQCLSSPPLSPAILMPPRRPTSPSPSPPPPPPSTPPSSSPSPLKAAACGGRLAHRESPTACTTSRRKQQVSHLRARTARTCTRAAAPPPAPIPPVLRFHRLRDRSRGGTHIRQQHTRNRGATARRMHRRPLAASLLRHAICARCRHACGRSLVVVCTQYGVQTTVVRMSPL